MLGARVCRLAAFPPFVLVGRVPSFYVGQAALRVHVPWTRRDPDPEAGRSDGSLARPRWRREAFRIVHRISAVCRAGAMMARAGRAESDAGPLCANHIDAFQRDALLSVLATIAVRLAQNGCAAMA